jgi:hypothetical protein
MPTRIITYAHRYKRPPRKKKAAPLPVPAIVRSGRKRVEASKPAPAANDDRKLAIVTVPSKWDRMRRREAASAGPEKSPEELEVSCAIACTRRPASTVESPGAPPPRLIAAGKGNAR